MKKKLSTELIDMLSPYGITDDEHLNAHLDLYTDLGIYGDEAIELMEAYQTRFNVNLQDFTLGKYVKGEGSDFFNSLFKSLMGKPITKYYPLTLGHLNDGIIRGKLSDADILS